MNRTVARIAEIDESTPLSDIDLSWSERDLPERLRTKYVHRLHPYLGKFVPQLVEIFLRKFFRPGQVIYDPFCGSGTTLVEANALGMPTLGCDISEFNCLLTRVKTDEYDIQTMNREVLDILEQTSRLTESRPLFADASEDLEEQIETDNEYLLNWYAPQALKELLTYRALIPRYQYQDLLKIILSRSARSARLVPHYDLDFPKQPQREPYWCYKHSRECRPVQEALKFLSRYSLDTIRRIKEFSVVRKDTQVVVLHDDARTVELPTKIDGVFTSPPYVGLIDYHEQHRYAYELLGLSDNRGKEIGPASNGTSQAAREEYSHEIARAFEHTASYLRDGGIVIIVVNDSRNLYDRIIDEAGLIVADKIERHVNRRTGRRSTEFYEEVIITKKG